MSTFRVTGYLNLDGSKFAAGMAQAENAAKRFGRNITSEVGSKIAGFFTLGALTIGIQRTIRLADEMGDLSRRLGVAVEWLQEMRFVAETSGSSLEELTGFMEKLGVARMKALGGSAQSPKILEAFQQFGIGTAQLQTATTAELVDAIGNAVKQTGRSDAVLGAFRDMGIKGAGSLLPAFLEGLEEGRANARASGTVMTAETVVRLKEIEERMTIFGMRLAVVMGDAILYAMKKLEDLRGIVSTAGAWWGGRTYNISGGEALAGIFTGGHLTKAGQSFWQKILSPENAKAGMDAYNNALKDWTKQNLADRSELAKRMAALMGGERPNYSFDQYTPKGPKKGLTFAGQSDELIKIGNFLGAGRDAVARLAERQLQTLEKIERNTRQSSNLLGSNTSEFDAE